MEKKTRTKRAKFLNLRTLAKVSVWVFAIILIAGPSFLHSKMGLGVSPILTGSMRPYANPGDVFITAPTQASALKVGDIISIHSQETGVFYAHRIVEIRIQSDLLRITTKGDANGAPEVDPFLVGADKSVPKVFMTLDWIGRPLIYLTSIQGRQASFSFVILANLIVLFFYLFKRREEVAEVVENLVHLPELILAQKKIEIQDRELKFSRNQMNEHIDDSRMITFREEFDKRAENDEFEALVLIEQNINSK